MLLAQMGCQSKQFSGVTVFAASSTTESMTEIAADFYNETGIQVRLNFAASSVLARQITSGAEADLFLAADNRWMDYLHASHLLAKKALLLNNQMVLICHPDLEVERGPSGELDMPSLFTQKVVLGDPRHVPAGVYARQILDQKGWWPSVAEKMVSASNVREALLLVERGEVMVGMVYATDALASNRVKVLFRFNSSQSPAIQYPVSLLKGSSGNAEQFFRYLFSEPAQSTFRRFGFLTTQSVFENLL